MKIAAFFSDSPFASWGQSRGFAAVLRRMGHEVVDIPVPPSKQVTRSQVQRINKPIDDCELVLVSGPEHLKDWINQFYPHWAKLKAPKVGWYHESFHAREDYQICYQNFEGIFDYHFFPDKDDAEKYKGEHLSLGVDTEMFRPSDAYQDTGDGEHWDAKKVEALNYVNPHRDIDSAFIGLMYPKRQRFYEELKPHLKGINLKVANGNVLVHGLDGLDVERTAKLMAETYRRIKVFVTFPSVCNVMVAKVLESMACGCYLVATEQSGIQNYASYSDAKHCAKEIWEALQANVYRERLARKGCEEVHKNHRMELRFEHIFKTVALQAQQPLAETSTIQTATI